MRIPARLLRVTAQPWISPETVTVAKHQEFIGSLPCIGCGKPAPSECASVRGIGNAGFGSAPSDRYLVPLCGAATIWEACCHDRHYFEKARFWSGLGIDPLALAFRLWRISGDRESGERAVMQARQAIGRQRLDGRVGPPRRTASTGTPALARPEVRP